MGGGAEWGAVNHSQTRIHSWALLKAAVLSGSTHNCFITRTVRHVIAVNLRPVAITCATLRTQQFPCLTYSNVVLSCAFCGSEGRGRHKATPPHLGKCIRSFCSQKGPSPTSNSRTTLAIASSHSAENIWTGKVLFFP